MNREHVFIIAEAGVNHNGSIDTAKMLIDVAALAKVDAVKFQSFKAEKIVTRAAEKTRYQKENLNTNESDQYSMLKKLELSVEQHLELIAYCKQKNVLFLSTPFDIESAKLLNSLNMNIFKVASGEITNLPLLRYIGSLGKEVILSTGMSTMAEIGQALDVLVDSGCPKENISVLHCNTEYPTPFEHVNLKAMESISNKFSCKVGYSDHTTGIEVPIAATALGAEVIEKHFTLDRNMDGPDHKASLIPEELVSMVQAIRNIEVSIGTGKKEPSQSEIHNLVSVRKSIVAKRKILEGEVFTDENLTTKRPASGLSPMEWDKVIGAKSTQDYEVDEIIK